MTTKHPSQPAASAPPHPQITIDGHPTTIWRHLPRQRPAGLHVREFHPPPDSAARPSFRTPHSALRTSSVPHSALPPAPSGLALVPTALLAGALRNRQDNV